MVVTEAAFHAQLIHSQIGEGMRLKQWREEWHHRQRDSRPWALSVLPEQNGKLSRISSQMGERERPYSHTNNDTALPSPRANISLLRPQENTPRYRAPIGKIRASSGPAPAAICA